MPKPLALIIEEDANLSKIFSLALQNEFETEICADSNSAFARVADAELLLIVIDLNLPGLQGKALLDMLRATPRLEKTHVILCTADEQQAELFHEQADLVMLKPVSPVQLRLAASSFLP